MTVKHLVLTSIERAIVSGSCPPSSPICLSLRSRRDAGVHVSLAGVTSAAAEALDGRLFPLLMSITREVVDAECEGCVRGLASPRGTDRNQADAVERPGPATGRSIGF